MEARMMTRLKRIPQVMKRMGLLGVQRRGAKLCNLVSTSTAFLQTHSLHSELPKVHVSSTCQECVLHAVHPWTVVLATCDVLSGRQRNDAQALLSQPATHKAKKRKEKTTPFGVNLMRNPVAYRAVQAYSSHICQRQHMSQVVLQSARAGFAIWHPPRVGGQSSAAKAAQLQMQNLVSYCLAKEP